MHPKRGAHHTIPNLNTINPSPLMLPTTTVVTAAVNQMGPTTLILNNTTVSRNSSSTLFSDGEDIDLRATTTTNHNTQSLNLPLPNDDEI